MQVYLIEQQEQAMHPWAQHCSAAKSKSGDPLGALCVKRPLAFYEELRCALEPAQ